MSDRAFAAAAAVLLAAVLALAVLLLARRALGAVPEAVEADSPLTTHAAAVWAAWSPRP